MTAAETDAERQLRHAQAIVKAAKQPEPQPTRVILPVVCTGRDGRTWPAHVYAWNPDRVWVCLECKEPRP
jgi:hypothetical protein